MNSKERIINAMELREVDRIPIFPVITFIHASRLLNKKVSEIVANPDLCYEALYRAWEYYGFDGFEVPALNEFVIFQEKLKAEIYNDELRLVNNAGKYLYKVSEDDTEIALEKLEMEITAILNQGYPDKAQLINKGFMDPVYQLIKRINNRAFITGHAPGQTLNSLVKYRGSDQAIFDLLENPDLTHKLFNHFTDASIELGKAFAEVGADAIYIGDAWASASIISPAMFSEFCVPYYSKAAKAFHGMGLKVYLHICGNSAPILEMMADTGVDAIEPLDPLGGVKLSDAKQRVGNRVCLKGGISTLTLLNGKEEEIKKEVLESIEQAGKTPGFIFGTGDDIPRDAPVKSVKFMCELVKNSNY
ncbi:MAG TPA: hypothetical protein DDW65_08230 [Firmicutes bacterium]|jgi:uroporphyrinogen decarboxylase|nr:hypothetical protein [Bacillota bacterium]